MTDDLDLTELRAVVEAGAVCREVDPELFFADSRHPGDTKTAKKICARCGVRQECLTVALVNNERFGVWGGLNNSERRQLRHSPDVTTLPEPSQST
jgi:WhiB family transcriptional regulator, redox-sensing transcriptional regulator